jgi:hypothetical protein
VYKNHEEVRKDFLMADWASLWPKLLLYTEKRITRMFWRGLLGGPLPGGIESHDIVMKAIEQALSGERQWMINARIDYFLFGAIKSVLNHLANSSENRSTCLITDEMVESASAHVVNSDIAAGVRRDPSVKAFFESLKGDPLVHDVASFILYYGVDKPEDLAHRIKRNVLEINNAKRRLKRKIMEWSRSAQQNVAESRGQAHDS